MKKVGFIDYYLDEWHANNYPEFISKHSDGRYEVVCAYGKIDSPIGGMTNKEWSEKTGIPLVDTIEEVVENSDVLIVLSPDNAEMHEELAKIPLASGKPTYIDKTFAPDKATALRIFENADRHGTKCCSSSALRFASELKMVDKNNIYKIYSETPGEYDIYAIHQIEPIIALMNTRAKRVMALSDKEHPSLLIEFTDGRLAQMHHCSNAPYKFTVVDSSNEATEFLIESDFFGFFFDELIKFFDTGIIPIPHEQTVDVISVIEAGSEAFFKPFCWVEV